jgi:hypothetical protein
MWALCVVCGEGDRGRMKTRRKIRIFLKMENSHLECGGEEWIKKYVLCV